MKAQKENSRERIIGILKHYQVLVGSIFFGVLISFLTFGFSDPVIPKGLGVAIIMVLLFGNIIYDYGRNDACSKCGKWTDIQQTDRIDKGGMLMPNGIVSMRKFRCDNCGHTWTEFYQERKHQH